jgi:iron complex outermembrane recepter protein
MTLARWTIALGLSAYLILAPQVFAQEAAPDAAATPEEAQPATEPVAPVPAPEADTSGVEEIFVTITKREESVQDIGGTIAAFGEETIQNANIENVGDLISLLPNVQVKSEDTDLSIRGVARAAFDSQSPVAYHINGVYQFNSLAYVGQFYDLQNVAIALGPSGTVYGRNANGGAIDLQWRKPTSDYGVSGDVTWAPEFDNYQFRSAVNIPLSGVDNDLLNARFVLTREVADGTVRNVVGTDRQGFGAKSDWYTRLSLRSQPMENLTLDLRGWYFKGEDRYAGGISLLPQGQRPSGVLGLTPTCGGPASLCFPFDWANGLTQFQAAVSNPASPFRPLIGIIRLQNPGMTLAQATQVFLLNGFSGVIGPLVRDAQFFTPVPAQQFLAGRKRSYSDLDALGPGQLQTWAIDGTVEYNMEGLPLFGDVDLFVLGGYGNIENEGLSESDATTYGALDTESKQVPETKRTVEVRLQSNNESWLNWTLGLFYVKNEVDQIRNTLTPLTISGATLNQVDTGYAPFANVTLKPIDPVEIFLGVRWNHDDFHRFEDANPNALSPNPVPLDGDEVWRETTLDAGVKWLISEDHMVYAKWARGYKAGFIQLLPNPAGALTPNDDTDDTIRHNVAPEVIIAQEIGAKTSWLDGKLKANFSAFHYDYTDLQVPTIKVIQIVNANAQAATVWGAELTLDARPIDDLSLRMAVGWLKAEFDKFCLDEPLVSINPPPFDSVCDLDGDGNIGDDQTELGDERESGGTDLSGKRLEDSPEFKISMLGSYRFDFGTAGSVTPILEFTWTDSGWRRPQNNPVVDRVPAYTKTDLRVRWDEPEHRYFIEAFGENLENNYIYPRGIVVALTGTAQAFGLLQPRTYGVRMGFNWGGK